MNISLLRNRSQPPGGWSYWCPVGEMDFPGGFSFDVQVDKIRSYRAANPNLNLPSDLGSCRNELLRFTYARLRRQYGAEEALRWFSVTDTDDAEINELLKKKPSNLPSEPPISEAAKPAGVIETAVKITAGVNTLADWVGHGASPVSPELAFSRASVCGGCTYNKEGNWLARLAGAVGGYIKEQIALKQAMNLSTPNDDLLTTCQICQCHLPLMVWTPIATLAERTTAEQLAKYPAYCWKSAEINELQYPTQNEPSPTVLHKRPRPSKKTAGVDKGPDATPKKRVKKADTGG